MSEAGTQGGDRAGREPRARLFCALDPPEDMVASIGRWQREQGDATDRLRPVRPESLHLTLAFLGDRPESDLPGLAAIVEGISPRPVEARLAGQPVPVPRRRPRLFALGLESPAAEELAAELSAALIESGSYRRPKRPFWPHLTVFRVRGQGRAAGPVRRPAPFPERDGHAFGFVRVALYRSELRPEGSKYSRLAATHLPQPGGQEEEVN